MWASNALIDPKSSGRPAAEKSSSPWRMQLITDSVTSVARMPLGNRYAAVKPSHSNDVMIFDAQSLTLAQWMSLATPTASNMDVSSDQKLLFTTYRHVTNTELAQYGDLASIALEVRDPRGTLLLNLPGFAASAAAWLPQNEQLAAIGFEGEDVYLYTLDPATEKKTLLTKLDVSFLGAHIAASPTPPHEFYLEQTFPEGPLREQNLIYRVSPSGAELETLITDAINEGFSVSPDGTRAVVSRKNQGEERYELWTLELPRGKTQQRDGVFIHYPEACDWLSVQSVLCALRTDDKTQFTMMRLDSENVPDEIVAETREPVVELWTINEHTVLFRTEAGALFSLTK